MQKNSWVRLCVSAFLCVSCFFVAQAQAEFSATGVVRDSLTGEALPFTDVYFEGST